MSLVPLMLLTAALSWWSRPQMKTGAEDNEMASSNAFKKFRYQYILVWSLVIAADWLQGPYVYALYESYGYSPDAISQLFVAGFGSSMIFGTFVGSLADSWGRKRCGMLYCVLYCASCVTKHSSNYSILMVGRVLGGIATSILFSAFECWMVSECNERHKFGASLLRYMFSLMFFVQYCVAILCGFVAEAAADALPLKRVPGYETIFYGGYTGPFDLSFLVLLLTFPLIARVWGENYGDNDAASCTFTESLSNTCHVLTSSWRVSLIGVVVAAFEGSMYAFVLNWTPALELEGLPEPPLGNIFAMLMMVFASIQNGPGQDENQDNLSNVISVGRLGRRNKVIR